MITNLIKPGTVFFFNKSKPSCDLQAGVLMVAMARTTSGNWAFRHLTKDVDHTVVIDGILTQIWFRYDDSSQETIIGQLPPGELHVTEWKPEYLLLSVTHPQPPATTLIGRAVGLLKRLW